MHETCPVKFGARETLDENEETFFFVLENLFTTTTKKFTAMMEAKQPFYLHFFNRNKSCLFTIYVPKVPLTVFERFISGMSVFAANKKSKAKISVL